MKRFLCSLATSWVVLTAAQAEVKLPGWMTSNMVLQQQTTMHLTATAKKGATVKITTSWDQQTAKVQADKQSGAFAFDLRVPAAGGQRVWRIVVECPEVPYPVAVRYAWADNPECNLITTSGLPVGPFRTDDWADFK